MYVQDNHAICGYPVPTADTGCLGLHDEMAKLHEPDRSLVKVAVPLDSSDPGFQIKICSHIADS